MLFRDLVRTFRERHPEPVDDWTPENIETLRLIGVYKELVSRMRDAPRIDFVRLNDLRTDIIERIALDEYNSLFE